jgi:AhpD family alkylhydroperoxidase
MDHPAAYAHLNASIGALAHAAPGVMSGFATLQQASQLEGALSAKVKELMALAIGIAVHCEGCVTYHVHDALRAGATPQEVAETVGIAVMMGGGPAVVFGAEALEALTQFHELAP